MKGNQLDTSLDLEEEIVRKNYGGSRLTKELTKRSWEFNDYLINFTHQNENFLLYEIGISFLLTLFMSCVFIGFLIREIGQMKYFYKKLFILTVSY